MPAASLALRDPDNRQLTTEKLRHAFRVANALVIGSLLILGGVARRPRDHRRHHDHRHAARVHRLQGPVPRPLAHIGLERWRAMIGVVMQDDELFAGSMADNVCFFSDHPDQGRIEQCARLAAVHEDIVAMPMGYSTLIGDMGTVLSGGQKQRVLIARALYREPRVLLLDEATSHLDVTAEMAVSAAIRGLALTRIVVAHRPETIPACDRVIHLDGKETRWAPRVLSTAEIPR